MGPDACSAEIKLIAGRERCTPERSARLRAASRPAPMREMRTIAFSTRCRSSSRATAGNVSPLSPSLPVRRDDGAALEIVVAEAVVGQRRVVEREELHLDAYVAGLGQRDDLVQVGDRRR